jgi:hypothetical protein
LGSSFAVHFFGFNHRGGGFFVPLGNDMVSRNDFGPTVTKGDNVIRGAVMISTVTNRFQHSPLFVSDGGQVGGLIVSEVLVQNELGDAHNLAGDLAHRGKNEG